MLIYLTNNSFCYSNIKVNMLPLAKELIQSIIKGLQKLDLIPIVLRLELALILTFAVVLCLLFFSFQIKPK